MILRCEVEVKLRCEKVRKGGVGVVLVQGRRKREGETRGPKSAPGGPKKPPRAGHEGSRPSKIAPRGATRHRRHLDRRNRRNR